MSIRSCMKERAKKTSEISLFIIVMTLAECVRSHAEITHITNDWQKKKETIIPLGKLSISKKREHRLTDALLLGDP